MVKIISNLYSYIMLSLPDPNLKPVSIADLLEKMPPKDEQIKSRRLKITLTLGVIALGVIGAIEYWPT